MSGPGLTMLSPTIPSRGGVFDGTGMLSGVIPVDAREYERRVYEPFSFLQSIILKYRMFLIRKSFTLIGNKLQ